MSLWSKRCARDEKASWLPGIEAKVIDFGEPKYVLNDKIKKEHVKQNDEIDENSKSKIKDRNWREKSLTWQQKYFDLNVFVLLIYIFIIHSQNQIL